MARSSSKRIVLPAYLLVIAAAALFVSSDVVTRGLDLDGVVYAALAIGNGVEESDLFKPTHYIEGASFTDQPPLGIWLEQQWFTLLGDAFYIEKLWGIAWLIGTCLAMAWCWQRLDVAARTPDTPGAWLPIALFFALPVTLHVAVNGYLENPLACVTTLAVAVSLRPSHGGSVVVGALVAIAVLIKGPTGLFPLAAPFLVVWLRGQGFGRAIGMTVVASAVCFGLLGLVLVDETARAFAARYLETQLIASLMGERVIDNGRGFQIGQIVLNVGAAAVLSFGIARFRNTSFAADAPTRLTTAIAATATLPLLVSPRQYGNYIFPGMPFVALAAACACRGGAWRRRLSRQTVLTASAALLICAAAITAMRFGSIGRHAPELQSAHAIGAYVDGQTLAVCTSASESYRVLTYLYRTYAIKSAYDYGHEVEFVLCNARVEDRIRVLSLAHGLGLWQRQ